MSPRPRKASNEQILAATLRAMARLAPGDLTLAAIAAEAGVTAAALVQRFGSKRALLLALAKAGAAGESNFLDQLSAKNRSPIAALREYARCTAQLASSPAALSRNLAYLQIDLTDPDFRKYQRAHARAARDGLERLVTRAVVEGELLAATNPTALARTIETVLGGSLLSWATYREGTASDWLRKDLDLVLKPWRN